MSMLYTLAYPALSETDSAFIERFRNEHDILNRDVVATHFTLVFGCSAVPEAEYRQHVASIANQMPAIPFSCRYAMLGADGQSETAYVFLVPDEGYSGLSLLHDRLYSGALEPHLQLDIPYTPHITIGTLNDRRRARQLCDELNRKGICIDGAVASVCVGALENGKIQNRASYPLRAQVPTQNK
jgi:2'-5' RNA ligase